MSIICTPLTADVSPLTADTILFTADNTLLTADEVKYTADNAFLTADMTEICVGVELPSFDSPLTHQILGVFDAPELNIDFKAAEDRAFFALAKLAEQDAGTEGQADDLSGFYNSELDPEDFTNLE